MVSRPWLRPQPRKYTTARAGARGNNYLSRNVAAPSGPSSMLRRRKYNKARAGRDDGRQISGIVSLPEREGARHLRHRQRLPSQKQEHHRAQPTNTSHAAEKPSPVPNGFRRTHTQTTAQVRYLPGHHECKIGRRKPFNRTTSPPGVYGRRPGGENRREYMEDAPTIAQRAPAKIGRTKPANKGGGNQSPTSLENTTNNEADNAGVQRVLDGGQHSNCNLQYSPEHFAGVQRVPGGSHPIQKTNNPGYRRIMSHTAAERVC